MRRIAWLTDIHLNFLPLDRVDEFLARLRAAEADAVLIGGDIGEAHDLVDYLERLAELPAPVYFVLGNHDYYHGSILGVRQRVRRLCGQRPRLIYLSDADAAVEIADGVGLVGHDGWADGRAGSYERSLVSMTDFRVIEDFAGLSKAARWPLLRALGDEAAAHIRRLLPAAAQRFGRVILLTHVPPLQAACWHEGRTSDDHWAPFFTCQAVGDAVLEIMSDRPETQLTVLCGHTHGAGMCRPLPNVEVLTGAAQYGQPEMQRVFQFE